MREKVQSLCSLSVHKLSQKKLKCVWDWGVFENEGVMRREAGVTRKGSRLLGVIALCLEVFCGAAPAEYFGNASKRRRSVPIIAVCLC